jgi:hypothetical protein
MQMLIRAGFDIRRQCQNPRESASAYFHVDDPIGRRIFAELSAYPAKMDADCEKKLFVFKR